MDGNNMDVDRPSTRATKPYPSLPLSQDERATINKRMATLSRIIGPVVAGDDSSQWTDLLSHVFHILVFELLETRLRNQVVGKDELQQVVQDAEQSEFDELRNAVRTAVRSGDWTQLAAYPKLWKSSSNSRFGRVFSEGERLHIRRRLTKAYGTPYYGDAVTAFLKYLRSVGAMDFYSGKPIYAKAIPVLQSSGTGKSRMLTEVGKQIFTLPICLRGPNDPGFPPPDLEVVEYFKPLSKDNDLSLSAHAAIACFVAAAHETMLELLQDAQKEKRRDKLELLSYWHNLMEPRGERSGRDQFFAKVINRANDLKKRPQAQVTQPSPRRGAATEVDITEFAQQLYSIIERPVQDLTKFLSTINGGDICVIYFDEAHELGLCFWILLRLLRSQASLTKILFVFMGTRSDISYYSPAPGRALSLRLREELTCLVPPYIALGFDQQAVASFGAKVEVCMGDLQTIKHQSNYGRPLWNAQLPEEKAGEMVDLAALKLVNGEIFSANSVEHVFAVLSQRLCLGPVLAGSEAVQLADRSVAHHMRLLTGFSDNHEIFYTHSPSEPILALGSAFLLYHGSHRWAPVLHTLSHDLCSAGLVEKGVLGELGARTLLVIARDFASPFENGRPNLLIPVRLLHLLDTLFGDFQWVSSNRPAFDGAFGDAYVNFTHWIVTRDPMPEIPDLQLLANLWARGAALQYCFTQESIDFLIPMYMGPVAAEAIFEPSCLSAVVGQVKYKVAGDKKAEPAIRPLGIPRDLHQPLPYLALLMELGNESKYQETHSKAKTAVSEPLTPGLFLQRTREHRAALDELERYQNQQQMTEAMIKKLKQKVAAARQLADSYNRYSISVRGASSDVYGILQTAKIVDQFDTLLKVTMPPPNDRDRNIQYMRPLERLSRESNHTSWMSEYVGTRMV